MGNIDAPDLITIASRGQATISAKAASAEKLLAHALIDELPKVRSGDPDGYKKLAAETFALTVVSAAVEAGVPKVAAFSTRLANSGNNLVPAGFVEKNCPGEYKNSFAGFWAGDADAIQRLIDLRGLPRVPLGKLARYLVQTEIDSGAESVAGPIDLLRLTSAGPTWLQRKPGCPVAGLYQVVVSE